jgi:hypothetical protein
MVDSDKELTMEQVEVNQLGAPPSASVDDADGDADNVFWYLTATISWLDRAVYKRGVSQIAQGVRAAFSSVQRFFKADEVGAASNAGSGPGGAPTKRRRYGILVLSFA